MTSTREGTASHGLWLVFVEQLAPRCHYKLQIKL